MQVVRSAMWGILLLGCAASAARGSILFDQYNGPPSPNGNPDPLVWAPDDIGWYWTPSTDVLLEGILTQLDTRGTNNNNNFTFTTTLYDERPAAGGVALGSFSWNGITFVDGPWLGGTFAAPIALNGGVQYFVGISGWAQAFIADGPDGGTEPDQGAGVNWIFDQVGEESVGIGSSYLSSSGNPGSFDTQLAPAGGDTDQGVLRFLAADPVSTATVPEPSTLAIFGIGLAATALRRRWKKT